ncbi:MAG: polyphosphate kinase 1 [Prosthecochloris sp.]|uniref:Polyphosphate kinase n=1 Tax=Prosthecochloris aestuarii (strain DSM 271 / SK 413) TaxID=290512 RepID=PPK1_PROA2|nr:MULTISPECIES: polyphosphate kinase 1 [Prosthecochloris]B4S7P3.1 RecName: Full=Polyphosphate kinase; AltName: Full=ATP-polyphosphate phosphotransferase; AltName: Full=Polyphosphoric acid kinase [Prosthecochloris aestuarii DSM 271]ACF46080.1 Polyphosphate kinase [Prosthecochloris aestuarii DSM 271]MCW8798149.1 polyphosphate kinase 1 [Prosthecochloris sp.]NEX11542.1 polyphosphate kinase 1 [Prosthecochloris sp.]RDD30406.1 polyphosphate kinase 1 [Prosthecochloris sp. ZM]
MMDNSTESVEDAVSLPDFDNPSFYVNRELSWMAFNQRVLEEALSRDEHPLLERIKFISIFSSNLDEFFMIRVAGLEDQYEAGVQDRSIDGMTPAEQLEKIREGVTAQFIQRDACFYGDICPELARHGIEFVDYRSFSESNKEVLQQYFRHEIFPVLTPLAFDTGHPFPFVSNLSLNLAIELEDLEHQSMKFARVKVPSILPRILRLDLIDGLDFGDDRIRLLWLDDFISHHLEQLFPLMRIVQAYPFRVIRDADIEIEEDEAGDLLETIEQGIRSRRYGKVVRLDVTPDMPESIRLLLIKHLEVSSRNVYEIPGALGLSSLMELMRIDKPELKDEPFAPSNPIEEKAGGDIFSAIRQSDHLFYHPYDSFQPVVDLINQAARDPQVLSIKQTLYRVGSNSPIVQALMHAVEEGKQVAVLVELKARFDEENNIVWARALENVGAHVVYGLVGLKTHAKLTMIVRREHDKLKRYLHLGTGNYNPATAKIYTDYSFLTANEILSEDVSELFNALTGYSRHTAYRKLIVSPLNTRKRIIAMIEREIEWHKKEGNGRIVMKMNALVDRKTIKALYLASAAGVQVDLIVRGICCLVPGIEGVSHNIRVISVIGRFLEHSRAYYFRNGGMDELFLGSADIMPRNLDHRVEVLFPVLDSELINVVKSELELILSDNVKAWQMNADGTYSKVVDQRPAVNSQSVFLQQASMKKSISKFKVNGL